MGLKCVYNCDICSEVPEKPTFLYGVHFTDMHNFTLGGYGSTDGKHICFGCASQLLRYLDSEPLRAELARYSAQHDKGTPQKKNVE
jgi:hypothetical protein